MGSGELTCMNTHTQKNDFETRKFQDSILLELMSWKNIFFERKALGTEAHGKRKIIDQASQSVLCTGADP